MTREEIIKALNEIKECPIGLKAWYIVALEMAIKALEQTDIEQKAQEYEKAFMDGFESCSDLFTRNKEQQPCEDAISRDFQIGDEVRIIGSDPIYDDCDVGWVIRNASEKVKTMYVMRNDGSADEEAKAEWYRTGRHNDTLAEVIRALPSVTQKWIPVSERLPEEETDVLICNGDGDIELSRGSYSTEVENDFIWYTSGWRFGKVIAWMPLPEPYEPQESEDEE